MLILSRKIGESIQIADNITVVVLGVKGNQVRLGVEAPKGVAVDRTEIAERKAAGVPRPVAAKSEESSRKHEPLYGNRTEAEWRQLLAQEQTTQENQEVNHGI